MTYSDYKKAFTQLRAKPIKMKKFIKHGAPKERKHGLNLKKCAYCGRSGSHISKYGLGMCRHCFRDFAPKLGFKKYS